MDITNMEAMEAEEFNMVMVVGVVKVMTAVRVVKMDRKELFRVEVRVGVGGGGRKDVKTSFDDFRRCAGT